MLYNEPFAPMMSTNRAMVATVLYRIAGCPEVTGEIPFADVEADRWYTDAIIWAASEGVVEGYGNGYFGPEDAVTREQMVAMLHRYAASVGKDTGVRGDLSIFADADRVSDYAVDSMQWAVGTGLIEGYTEGDVTILNSQGDALRCQVAALLMRLCENVLK